MWKKLLFALLVCVAFFVVLELVLLACGVRPILYDEDPYVGFASQIRLFVEQEAADGRRYLVTAENKRRFFNDQRFPRDKGPGVMRIFCMGGSTTFGRPYDDATSFCGWLRESLPAADPSRRWEVVNAGGISYASYRVAALMEELCRYQPDLFIIYTGHNEFLERRTYAGIIETPAPLRGVGAMLSRTRTYAVLYRIVRSLRTSPSAKPDHDYLPAEVETELDQSAGPDRYTRDEPMRRQVLAHYRYNLARMIRIARSAGAKVVLVTPAANLRNCSPFKSEHRSGLADADRQRWQTLFDRAESAFREGRLAQSLAAADGALEIDDQYAHLHYLRGRVLDGLDRHKEAKAAYRLALDHDICPLRAPSDMSRILAEVAQEWDVPVVDLVERVESGSPHGIPGKEWFFDHVHLTIEGHRMLALALVDEMARQGMVRLAASWNDAAIEKVTQAVRSRIDRKEHGRALRNLAQVLSWAGKTEDAYDAARKALEMAPKDAEANYLLASLAQKLGKRDEAIRHYQILLRADLDPKVAPYVVKAHYSYGAILAWQGKFDQSEKHLRQALAMSPEHPEATKKLPEVLIGRGRQLIESGRPQEAIEKLREVLRSHGQSPEAHQYMGVALLRLNRPAEGAAHLKKAVALKPDYALAHNNLGVVLAGRGQMAEAQECFSRAVRIQPDYAEAHHNLGKVRLGQRRYADAEAHLRQALKGKPRSDAIWYDLGIALDGRGRTAEAAKAYLEAVRLNDRHAAAHNRLGVVLAKLGNLSGAEARFRRALEIDPNFREAQDNLRRVRAQKRGGNPSRRP